MKRVRTTTPSKEGRKKKYNTDIFNQGFLKTPVPLEECEWVPSESPNPERTVLFKEFIEDVLSPDAQEIVRLLLEETPQEMIDLVMAKNPYHGKNGITPHIITKYLRAKSWAMPAIENVLTEIKTGLKELAS